jgi:GNAT superfamily N-acetyltransferase
MNDALIIRNMARPELTRLVDWAATEGWNPGLHDADLFWATDPEAYLAAELDGEVIGGGAITSYGGLFGFMGFFIVRPEFRGRGLGNTLWHARRDRLLARLQPGASIGMDGVFNMQAYYAKGGFIFSHRDIRYQLDGPVAAAGPETLVPLAQLPFVAVAAYDRGCFPAPREGFLRGWIAQPDALAIGCLRNGALAGYAVVRACGTGSKVGPLFADDARAADALLVRAAAFASPGPLFLDVPENNPAAIALARDHGMREVFGCARMYLGPAPAIAHERVFGVTTFELG